MLEVPKRRFLKIRSFDPSSDPFREETQQSTTELDSPTSLYQWLFLYEKSPTPFHLRTETDTSTRSDYRISTDFSEGFLTLSFPASETCWFSETKTRSSRIDEGNARNRRRNARFKSKSRPWPFSAARTDHLTLISAGSKRKCIESSRNLR